MHNILIIEDTEFEFIELHQHLSLKGYLCYPEVSEYNVFKNHLMTFLDYECEDEKPVANSYFNNYFKDKKFNSIILDINLLPDSEDVSGLEFLKYLRKRYEYVPVIMFTRHSFDVVQEGFEDQEGMANYYLSKHSGNEYSFPSDEYFRKKLDPVLSMLCFWQKVSHSNDDIFDLLQKNNSILLQYLSENFGLLRVDLNSILGSTHDIVNYSKILVGISQYNLKKNDISAAMYVETLLDQVNHAVDIPAIKKGRKNIIQRLTESKNGFVKIIEDGTKEEVFEYLSSIVKEYAGSEEDDNVLLATATLILNTTRKLWKFVATGDI